MRTNDRANNRVVLDNQRRKGEREEEVRLGEGGGGDLFVYANSNFILHGDANETTTASEIEFSTLSSLLTIDNRTEASDSGMA